MAQAIKQPPTEAAKAAIIVTKAADNLVNNATRNTLIRWPSAKATNN